MAPKKAAKRAAKGSDEALDVGAIKRLKSALRSRQGQPNIDALSKAYSEADHEKKAEILEKFAEDAKLSWASSFISSSTSLDEDADKEQGQWLTKQQVAKEEALNVEKPEDELQLTALLKDLKAKAHWLPSLAAQGVQLYHYTKVYTLNTKARASEHRVQEILVNGPKAKAKAKQKALPATSNTSVQIDWAVACDKQRTVLRILCEKADRFVANGKADLRKHTLPDMDQDAAKTTLQQMGELVKEGEEMMDIGAQPDEAAQRAMKDLVEQLTIGFGKGQVSFFDLFSKNQITLKRKMMSFEPKGKGKGKNQDIEEIAEENPAEEDAKPSVASGTPAPASGNAAAAVAKNSEAKNT
eukprot:s2333_g10.t1